MSRRPAGRKPSDADRQSYAVPALEKGLDVLEFLAKS